MSINSSIVRGVRRISLYFHTTENAINALKKLIDDKLISPEDFPEAVIKYRVGFLPDAEPDNPHYFPLKFYDKRGTQEIWVSSVNAGYRGTGPHGTLEALKLMGFELTNNEKEEIFTNKNINLQLLKRR